MATSAVFILENEIKHAIKTLRESMEELKATVWSSSRKLLHGEFWGFFGKLNHYSWMMKFPLTTNPCCPAANLLFAIRTS